MIELEIEILRLFAYDKKNIKKVLEILRKNKEHLNDNGVNGPLFNLLLGTRVFLTPGIVIEMLQNGFDLAHENNALIVHKALINNITTCYTDELYNVLEILCSSAHFIDTIPKDEVLNIVLNTDYDPDPVVINLLLQYDTNKVIKTELIKNNLFREKLMSTNHVIYDLIINC